MKLEYLQTAQLGVQWFRGYYRKNPQLNLAKAVSALRIAERTLQENPMAGERFDGFDAVREYKINGTAFSLLYTIDTIHKNRILVIDLRDQRGLRSAEALHSFVQDLRQRNESTQKT
jgi:hypothetical protein